MISSKLRLVLTAVACAAIVTLLPVFLRAVLPTGAEDFVGSFGGHVTEFLSGTLPLFFQLPGAYANDRVLARVEARLDGGHLHLRIRRSPTTMGRGWWSSHQIILGDPYISRRHATIYFAGGSWYIFDEGSAHGTFVNGQRLNGTHARLDTNYTITMGQTTLTFTEGRPL